MRKTILKKVHEYILTQNENAVHTPLPQQPFHGPEKLAEEQTDMIPKIKRKEPQISSAGHTQLPEQPVLGPEEPAEELRHRDGKFHVFQHHNCSHICQFLPTGRIKEVWLIHNLFEMKSTSYLRI